MRKLNNKGYLTVEIVVASVMAFAVAFFLMDLTIKLVNDTEDAYVDTVLTTDKGLIMKNLGQVIDDNLGSCYIASPTICENTSDCIIKCNGSEKGKLSIKNSIIEYTSGGSVLYSKKISDKLKNVKITGVRTDNSDYAIFKIAGENIFSDKNYDIYIFVNVS